MSKLTNFMKIKNMSLKPIELNVFVSKEYFKKDKKGFIISANYNKIAMTLAKEMIANGSFIISPALRNSDCDGFNFRYYVSCLTKTPGLPEEF